MSHGPEPTDAQGAGALADDAPSAAASASPIEDQEWSAFWKPGSTSTVQASHDAARPQQSQVVTSPETQRREQGQPSRPVVPVGRDLLDRLTKLQTELDEATTGHRLTAALSSECKRLREQFYLASGMDAQLSALNRPVWDEIHDQLVRLKGKPGLERFRGHLERAADAAAEIREATGADRPQPMIKRLQSAIDQVLTEAVSSDQAYQERSKAAIDEIRVIVLFLPAEPPLVTGEQGNSQGTSQFVGPQGERIRYAESPASGAINA